MFMQDSKDWIIGEELAKALVVTSRTIRSDVAHEYLNKKRLI